ncbi:MAG TPA: SCO1664 family protein [Ardenticatenaceae bacterium]|nr:SCO1664 family protein [Ardenticatenaceae bacterium]
MSASEPPEAAEPGVEQAVVSPERAVALLEQGDMEVEGELIYSSNYTFLASVEDESLRALVVYKPRRGERPLWDFPSGTLCQRECAAYLVSEALGWQLVPPTVLRDGPLGVGMVQLYIEHDPEEHYFTFRDEILSCLPRVALFDAAINNADRKGGHCLRDARGHVWCIDHGIAFHEDHKLRTVIWDFAGEEIPEPLLDDLRALQDKLDAGGPLAEALEPLLASDEIAAFRRRVARLIRQGRFPRPGPGRHVPWPMV